MEQKNTKKCRLPVLQERLNDLLGDMTTTDFAKKVGLTRQTMGFYLNGDRIPDSETLAQICKSCNVSADYLLGLSNVKNPDINIHGICKFTGLSEKNAALLYSTQVICRRWCKEGTDSEEYECNANTFISSLLRDSPPDTNDDVLFFLAVHYNNLINDLIEISVENNRIFQDYMEMLDVALESLSGSRKNLTKGLDSKLVNELSNRHYCGISMTKYIRFISSEIAKSIDSALLKRYYHGND